MAIIEITTSSSMRVNARRETRGGRTAGLRWGFAETNVLIRSVPASVILGRLFQRYTIPRRLANTSGTATSKDVFSQTLTYTYDAADNVTVVQDSKGGTATMTFDAANRRTNAKFT